MLGRLRHWMREQRREIRAFVAGAKRIGWSLWMPPPPTMTEFAREAKRRRRRKRP